MIELFKKEKKLKKKYYKILTSMQFERVVLVPVESVQDLDEAIEVVDAAVEAATLMLLDQDADCCTEPIRWKNDSIVEVDEKYMDSYKIFGRDF